MTYRSLVSIALLLLLLPPAVAGAELDRAIERFTEFATAEMERDETPGMSIGFVYGERRWADGFGFADLENRVPATAASAYRLASVTKPMTAMGTLTLWEQGKLDLDEEVQTYVPYFPRKEFPVTPRLLLGHLGGISHYRNYDLEGHFKDHKDTREAIAVFADFDLVGEPGSVYQYSSYGYNLLGAVIEGASGMSYADFMRTTLWAPLGMDATRMDDPSAIIPNRVTGYRPAPGGGVMHSEFVDISSRFAAGGTRSTVEDLLSFARGVLDRKILSESTYAQMWTPMELHDGESTGYGMGWGVRPLNGRFKVQHGGGQAETRTFLVVFPQDDLALAVACNFEGADYMPYLRRLYTELTGEPWGMALYTGGPMEDLVLDALVTVFNHGLGYLDRVGAPVTTDSAALATAFGEFNELLELAMDPTRREEAGSALEAAHRREAGNLYHVVGSAMAAQLAAERGPDYLDRAHGRGALPFLADYVALTSADGPLALSSPVAAQVEAWTPAWEVVWTPEALSLPIASASDVGELVGNLQERFGGLALRPDYSDQLLELQTRRFLAGDLPGAAAAVQAAMELYPTRDRPLVYAGVMQLAQGERASGVSLIRRALELDPRGAASARDLNLMAYDIKGMGLLPLGLQVLGVAVELHPEVANLYDSIGEFHLDAGDREEAIRYYRRAVEVDPDFENARRVLAELGASADL